MLARDTRLAAEHQSEQRALTLDMPSDKREPDFAVTSRKGGRGAADALPASVSAPVPVAACGEPGAGGGAMPQAGLRGADDRLPVQGPGARARGGIALSLMLHVAVAWAVFFGGDSVRELPAFRDEPVEVVLADWPAEEAPTETEELVLEEPEEEEEAEAPPPPPPPAEEDTAQAEPPPPEEAPAEEAEEETPPDEAPKEEAPKEQEPALPAPAEAAAPPRVLIPVTEFAEEDGGSAERAGETGLRDGIEETPEAARDEVSSQAEAGTGARAGEDADDAPAGEGPEEGAADGPEESSEEGREDSGLAGTTEGAPEGTAEETAEESEVAQASGGEEEPREIDVAALGEPAEAEVEAAAEAEALGAGPADAPADEGAGELDVLAVPGEGPGEVAAPASGLPPADTRARPREKPAELAARGSGERIDLAALADLGARAEAVSRALATRRRATGGGDGGGGDGGGGGEITGGTTATRLFSRDISDDPRMRTAMNGMPQAARVDLLCMTELRAQLRAGRPPYHADLLPSFRFEAGNVLQPRRAAFRAGGQWYELDFRCELNAGVTRVESFSHRVGAPVPRAEWSARGFPGN